MKLADVIGELERRFPPGWAEPWDRVGLVVGHPAQSVERVLCAVDVTPTVIAEAQRLRAELILAHHPLLLRPVSTVAATTPAGAMIHEMIENGIALFVAHTNADVAQPGVNDALAAALGLTRCTPLRPMAGGPDGCGHGRVGRLAGPVPLRDFAASAARALPTGTIGVRVAADPDRIVQVVAVCGGSGDEFLPDATASGADVYVTGDLKHHRTIDHLLAGGPALIDAGHWATEEPWLGEVAKTLASELGITATVAEARTDPWTIRAAGA